MKRSSYFIENKALFGSYPTQEEVIELEKMGVKYFVDLTHSTEKKITPYKTNCLYINYPINDSYVPTDWNSFSMFIIYICDIISTLKDSEKIYLHCKGGHGRSGVVVACIFCYLYRMSPTESLLETSRCHSNRQKMKEKWRILGSPQTYTQKLFISKFFNPIIITEKYSCEYCITSKNHVRIKGFEMFNSTEEVYESIKDLAEKQQETYFDINKNIDIFLLQVLKAKFENNTKLANILKNTGLRPLKPAEDSTQIEKTICFCLQYIRESMHRDDLYKLLNTR